MPKGIKNPRQIKVKTSHTSDVSQHSATEKGNTLTVDPSNCAYLLKAGDCRSPASHPGTSFFEQRLDAATPLY